MPITEDHLAELKRAYEILGVPLAASALSIKQAYRRLANRWHPDRYQTQTTAYVEATFMMQLINEAYGKVQHAPLRYHIESYPAAWERRKQSTRPAAATTSAADPIRMEPETLPITDRLEFWVRFVVGSGFGVLVGFGLALRMDSVPAVIVGSLIFIIMLACGYASARYGDEFWHVIFGMRWP